MDRNSPASICLQETTAKMRVCWKMYSSTWDRGEAKGVRERKTEMARCHLAVGGTGVVDVGADVVAPSSIDVELAFRVASISADHLHHILACGCGLGTDLACIPGHHAPGRDGADGLDTQAHVKLRDHSEVEEGVDGEGGHLF